MVLDVAKCSFGLVLQLVEQSNGCDIFQRVGCFEYNERLENRDYGNAAVDVIRKSILPEDLRGDRKTLNIV